MPETVIAVQVRSVDPPQFVAEDMDDLREQFPGEWGGEQCDSCGLTAYTIEPDPEFGNPTHPLGWRARCSGSEWLADEYKQGGADPEQVEAVRKGCGATYRLSIYNESEVQF